MDWSIFRKKQEAWRLTKVQEARNLVEKIVLGGEICNLGDRLLLPIKQSLHGYYGKLHNMKKEVDVRVGKFINDAGFLGSAILAMRLGIYD